MMCALQNHAVPCMCMGTPSSSPQEPCQACDTLGECFGTGRHLAQRAPPTLRNRSPCLEGPHGWLLFTGTGRLRPAAHCCVIVASASMLPGLLFAPAIASRA